MEKAGGPRGPARQPLISLPAGPAEVEKARKSVEIRIRYHPENRFEKLQGAIEQALGSRDGDAAAGCSDTAMLHRPFSVAHICHLPLPELVFWL